MRQARLQGTGKIEIADRRAHSGMIIDDKMVYESALFPLLPAIKLFVKLSAVADASSKCVDPAAAPLSSATTATLTPADNNTAGDESDSAGSFAVLLDDATGFPACARS
jgi:hypothetical protein